MAGTLYIQCNYKISTTICRCPDGDTFSVKGTNSCPAGTTTAGYTAVLDESKVKGSNSVLLSTGSFVFQQPLLSISAIGTGSFRFGLNYNAGQLGSRALGSGFQFAQNVRISRFDNGDVVLDSGNFASKFSA